MGHGMFGQREADKRWRDANPEKVKEQKENEKIRRKTETCPKCGGSGADLSENTKCSRCKGKGLDLAKDLTNN